MSRTISGLGDTLWIDGGTGIDMLPIFPLLENPRVSEIYLISYNHANKTRFELKNRWLITRNSVSLPKILDDIDLLRNGIAAINDMRVDLVVGGNEWLFLHYESYQSFAALESASKASIPTFSFIPTLNQTVWSFLFWSNIHISIFSFLPSILIMKEFNMNWQWSGQ